MEKFFCERASWIRTVSRLAGGGLPGAADAVILDIRAEKGYTDSRIYEEESV
jgi:hypothetical protein